MQSELVPQRSGTQERDECLANVRLESWESGFDESIRKDVEVDFAEVCAALNVVASGAEFIEYEFCVSGAVPGFGRQSIRLLHGVEAQPPVYRVSSVQMCWIVWARRDVPRLNLGCCIQTDEVGARSALFEVVARLLESRPTSRSRTYVFVSHDYHRLDFTAIMQQVGDDFASCCCIGTRARIVSEFSVNTRRVWIVATVIG